MDNVIHTLCGLTLARAGIARAGSWSTATLLLASNIPDLDGLGLLWGGQPWYLCNHRGITHALPGLALESVLLGLLVCAVMRWRGRPVSLAATAGVALIGFLTHLGLDALNTYGVRPWLPFDLGWVYLDIAFVADPWVWLILILATALGGPPGWRPATGWTLLGAAGSALLFTAERAPLPVAIAWTAGFAAVLLLRVRGAAAGLRTRAAWTGLCLLMIYLALLLAGSRAANRRGLAELAPSLDGPVQHSSTHPQPGVPWRYRVIAQTPDRLHRAVVDLRRGTVEGFSSLPRRLETALLPAVVGTREYRVWKHFARHPFAGVRGDLLILGDGRYSWAVEPSWANLSVSLQGVGEPASIRQGAWTEEEVGDGVFLRQRRFAQLFGARQSVTVLEVRHASDSARLRFSDAGGLQPTSALAAPTAAVAAVNGGYFTREGAAVGLLRIDGRLLYPNEEARQTAIGVDPRERIVVRPAPIGDWPEVPHALSAGPTLVIDGAVEVAPGFAHEQVRHPRTALGLTAEATLLVTVDGRTPEAAGMTCEELALLMVSLGCRTAVNLDGGGSTTMWVRSAPDAGVVNHPSDNGRFDHGGERAVGNAVLILASDVIVRDNDRAELDGDQDWRVSRDGEGFLGEDYVISASPEATARWRIPVDFRGTWTIMARWPDREGLAAAATLTVAGRVHDVDQSRDGGNWVRVAEVDLAQPGQLDIVLRASPEGGLLAADAVRLAQRR